MQKARPCLRPFHMRVWRHFPSLLRQMWSCLGPCPPWGPISRVLLRVQISDAVEADRIFSVLMGEVVEPRRAFIERFAREVRFLDV